MLPAHPRNEEHEEAQRRNASADLLDAASVAVRLERVPDEVAALRKAGKVLAAWLSSSRRFLFRPWQFDERGNHVPELAALLALLRSRRGLAGRFFEVLPVGLDRAGWLYPHQNRRSAIPGAKDEVDQRLHLHSHGTCP